MSWKKVKLSELLSQLKIIVPIDNNKEYKLVTVSSKGTIRQREIVKGLEIKGEKAFEAKRGKFIYSRLSVHNGAFGIVPSELDGALLTSEMPIFEISDKILPEFLIYSLQLPTFKFQLEQLTKGVGRTRVKEANFLSLIIDLPNISDQENIIKSLIKTEQHSELISSELSHQLNLLIKLRQQLLQDAVQGKLVEQNKNDEPASELLKKIKAEKAKLIAEKVIKQGKIQEAEKQEELLFEIPPNWIWCTLDEISKNITDGTHQTPVYTKEGRIFLSAQNIKPFKFMPEEHKFVSEKAYEEIIKNRKPEKGDILIARVGAGIGEAAVINQDIDFCFYVSLGLVQPFKEFLNTEYLTLVINSPYGVKYAKGNISSKGGSAGNFNLGRIRSFLIPLPPLAEQERIIQKVEELMQYCNELEASIKQSETLNEKLLQQVLREALRKEEVSV